MAKFCVEYVEPSFSDCDCLLPYVLPHNSSSYEEAQQQCAFGLPALCLPR